MLYLYLQVCMLWLCAAVWPIGRQCCGSDGANHTQIMMWYFSPPFHSINYRPWHHTAHMSVNKYVWQLVMIILRDTMININKFTGLDFQQDFPFCGDVSLLDQWLDHYKGGWWMWGEVLCDLWKVAELLIELPVSRCSCIIYRHL